MASQLPPGWSAHQDPETQQTYFVNQQTGETQWEPPIASPGVGPAPSRAPGAHGRTASVAGPAAPRSKRVYAANQADAYGAGTLAGPGGSYGANQFDAQAPYGTQTPIGGQQQPQQPQFFSPGIPEQQQPQYFGAPGQQPGQAPTPVYGQQSGQPAYGQPQYGQPAVNGVAQQFGQMNIGQQQARQPLVGTTNLIHLPLNPAELAGPPAPPINLPPGASISQHPLHNADPSYQRSTINAVPLTSQLLNKSKVPFAIICTPYRSVKAGSEEEVPVVADTVIARCRRCRTYINPYVTFIEGGNRWKCCMCNLSNEVPQLFDWDQQTNQPADRWQRAELNHAVVDFIAPTEYMVRPPQPPVYVFLIDVSYAAIHSGMVATAARTILESLDRLPNDDNRTKISIIAVDATLHFFRIPPEATEPTMLVVGDLDDVFLPEPQDLLVNLTECRAGIENLLGRLNDMFKESTTIGNATGAALQAAYKMVSSIGGKIMVLTSSLPSVGPGALRNREDPKLFGTAKSGFYKTLAIDCSRAQVSVDMWLFSSQYTDVATLSSLPRYTGGQTYFYPAYDASRSEDALKFAHEFSDVLAQPILLEAVMRVRATKGLRMSAFHGNFFVRSTDLLALPAVPTNQSYAIEIQIEDPLTTPFVVFQTAVLHTSSAGERRIRVVTQAIPTTSSIAEIYGSIDAVALTTLLANKAVERSNQAKLEDARDAITNKLVDILSTYKSHMTAAGSGASPQLVISENMKHLPLLLLGLLKHSSQIPSDLRAYAQALLTTLPAQQLIPFLHPTFYSLHNMPREAGIVGDDGVVLPPPLPLSSERLERHGLFLIENGQEIFLWIGRDAVPQLIKDVFDLPSYQDLRGGKTTLPILENDFSQRVNRIIGKVREARRGPYYPHLYVVKEDGEPSLRMWALSMLVEDAQPPLPSYQQWLTNIKDKVNGSS